MQKKDIRNPLTIVSYLLIKAARRADMLLNKKPHISQPETSHRRLQSL